MAELEDQDWVHFLTWDYTKRNKEKLITYPHEYNDSSELCLTCTQVDGISPYAKQKLVQEWCALIPTLTNLKNLRFYSKVNQKLFNSACENTNLEGLYIKWSGNGITDLSPISKLKNLKRLYISNCSQISSLAPLSSLKNLEWLQIFEFRQLTEVEPITKLKKLKGLMLNGSGEKLQEINNFDFLSTLHNLLYLDLSRIKAKSEDLTPITKLTTLKYLDIPMYYPMEEFAKLFAKLKTTDHGISAYRDLTDRDFYRCKKCGEYKMVLPMSKGKREICRICQSEKIIKLKNEFNELVKKYS